MNGTVVGSSNPKLYAERDIMEQGQAYCDHVNAMTAEGLHDKSDIAAELAHRDIEIARLQDRCIEFSANLTIAERQVTEARNDLDRLHDTMRGERAGFETCDDLCVKCRTPLPALETWSGPACPACTDEAETVTFLTARLGTILNIAEGGLSDRSLPEIARLAREVVRPALKANDPLAQLEDDATFGEIVEEIQAKRAANVLSTEICPTGDDYPHKAHKGKCMYCGAPMPSSSEDAV